MVLVRHGQSTRVGTPFLEPRASLPSVVPPILWPGSPSLTLDKALHMNQRPVWHRPLSRLNQKNPGENTAALTPCRLGKPLALVVERNWCQNPPHLARAQRRYPNDVSPIGLSLSGFFGSMATAVVRTAPGMEPCCSQSAICSESSWSWASEAFLSIEDVRPSSPGMPQPLGSEGVR